MERYGPLARGVRWLLQRFTPTYRWDVPATDTPVVYVCRHLHMHGPLTLLKWAPADPAPLVLDVFFDRRHAKQHFCRHTFAPRSGRPRRFCLLAWLLGTVSPPMMASLGAVPVHRDARAPATLKAGVKQLLQGRSLLIFPDRDYAADYTSHSSLYGGFVALGTLYARRTGRPLTFVPLVVDDKGRRITAGRAVAIHDHHRQPEALAQLEQATVSIGVYPEGTRNKGPGLLPFHDGVFKIAQRAGVPLVVVYLHGTQGMRWRPFRRQTALLRVVDVLPAHRVRAMTTHQLGELVRIQLLHQQALYTERTD